MHYTNPTGAAGVIDNSGMIVQLADKLRKYDAGVALLGPVDYEQLIRVRGMLWMEAYSPDFPGISRIQATSLEACKGDRCLPSRGDMGALSPHGAIDSQCVIV